MRILFTVSGWAAHWFPMVPLGWALQAAGHEVRVACPPAQRGAVADAGLVPVPVLADLDMTYLNRFANLSAARAGTWAYPWPPLHPDTGAPVPDVSAIEFGELARRVKQAVASGTEQGYARTLEFARAYRADVVVHDRLSADGLLAARVLGIPAIAHLWGPVGTTEPDPALYPMPVDYTGAFPRYGLPPLSAELVGYVLDPCPPELAPPVSGTRLPVRYVPYNGPGGVPADGAGTAGRPRVCVLWSNSMSRTYGLRAFLVPLVVRALAGLDVEVLLPVHPDDARALGELPANVRPLGQVPLHLLLPGCAAVVHHGGAGCAMTALVAGVPQLVLSLGPEQEANGSRLAAAGVARHLPGHSADEAAVAAAVTALLDGPATADRAARLAASAGRRPTPAAVVSTVEDLARHRGG